MFYMTAYPLQFNLITDATAVSTEPSEMQTLGRNLHGIQVSGTFAATVLVEATLDGQTWEQLDTITTAGIKQYSGVYASIRVSVSAYTSGSVFVFGLSQRS
jgi:hypothetical protein